MRNAGIKKAQLPMVFVLDGDKRLEWLRPFGLFRLEKKMNKKKWIRIVSIYSVIYTVITLLNSALYLCNGIYEDPSGNWHELDRAMILLIGIAAFELCTNLPVKPLVLRFNFTGFFVLLCIINTAVYVFKKKEGRKEKEKRNDRGCK